MPFLNHFDAEFIQINIFDYFQDGIGAHAGFKDIAVLLL